MLVSPQQSAKRVQAAGTPCGARAAFILLLTAYLLYAALFIYRTSFLIDGQRYFSLFDDAMVSMRYARNLAHGYGLVWNPGGERVEGFTNPLWVFYMAIVHLLPIAQAKISVIVQITGAILLACNLVYVRRIALAVSEGSEAVAGGAVVLTAAYLPLNNWSLQGTEFGALVLLTTACTWVAIRSLESGAFPRRLYLLLGAGTWIRPDVVVLFGAFLTFMLLADRSRWRNHLGWGAVILTSACAIQTALRFWYYGDILPNTYYLKVAGIPVTVRLARGLYVLLQFVWKANALLFALPFALALRSDRRICLLLWILVVQMAYSVYVGGDAWEYWGGSNRYISLAMPGFFVALTSALWWLAGALTTTGRGDRALFSAAWHPADLFFALTVGYAVLSLNSIYGVGALAEALLIRPPLHTGSSGENQDDVEMALSLRRSTAPDATVAVMRAGTIPYFAERSAIDLLGKNDRHVAHERARLPSGVRHFQEFRPGHVKFDFAYSVAGLRPDLIVQLRRREELARPFLQDYEDVRLGKVCAYARRGSPNVHWDRLAASGCEERPQASSSNSASGLLQGVLSGS